MDDRAVSTVQTALAETRWLPVSCPTEYLPALARDVLYALEKAGMAVVELPKLTPNREGTPAWTHRLVEVTGRRGGIYVSPVGIKTMDGPPIFLPIEFARSCAAALLAAALVAESVSVVATPQKHP